MSLEFLKTKKYICPSCGTEFKSFPKMDDPLCDDCFDEYQNAIADESR